METVGQCETQPWLFFVAPTWTCWSKYVFLRLFCSKYDEKFQLNSFCLWQIARKSSQLTHCHPEGYNGAILQAYAIHLALFRTIEMDADEFLRKMQSFCTENLENSLVFFFFFVENFFSRFLSISHENSFLRTFFLYRSPEKPFTARLSVVRELLEKESVPSSVVTEKLGHSVSALDAVPMALFCALRSLRPIPNVTVNSFFWCFSVSEKNLVFLHFIVVGFSSERKFSLVFLSGKVRLHGRSSTRCRWAAIRTRLRAWRGPLPVHCAELGRFRRSGLPCVKARICCWKKRRRCTLMLKGLWKKASSADALDKLGALLAGLSLICADFLKKKILQKKQNKKDHKKTQSRTTDQRKRRDKRKKEPAEWPAQRFSFNSLSICIIFWTHSIFRFFFQLFNFSSHQNLFFHPIFLIGPVYFAKNEEKWHCITAYQGRDCRPEYLPNTSRVASSVTSVVSSVTFLWFFYKMTDGHRLFSPLVPPPMTSVNGRLATDRRRCRRRRRDATNDSHRCMQFSPQQR